MVKRFIAFSLIGLLGCSTVGFTYRFYYPRLVSYKGQLLGPTTQSDLDAEATCKPDDRRHTKCVVMKLDEFLRLKGDYLQLQADLNACQRES